MSDIDGTVEVNGRFLFLEWKGFTGDIPTGQRIYFERLTRLSPAIAVIVCCGSAETMEITHRRHVYLGRVSDWEQSSLQQLQDEITEWAKWCRTKPI